MRELPELAAATPVRMASACLLRLGPARRVRASSLISAPLWLFGLIAMDWRDLGQGPQPLYDHVVWYVLVPTFDVCAVVFAISAIVAFYYRAALLASGLSPGLSGTLFWLWHSVPFPANS